MSTLTPTTALRAARNAATITRLDDGPASACIRLYTASGGVLLGTRRLRSPCGTVRELDGRIELHQSDVDDLVVADGDATHAELVGADGTLLGVGDVSAAGEGGAFQLASTTLLAGGVLRLTEPALLG